MPKPNVHRIVSENKLMRKVCAKLVPKVLSDEQKHRRVAIYEELKKLCADESDFLDDVTTGDESWLFENDLETER